MCSILNGVEYYEKIPISKITTYGEKDPFLFTGYIDLIFQHDNGVILVDWKTDRNSDKAAKHKHNENILVNVFILFLHYVILLKLRLIQYNENNLKMLLEYCENYMLLHCQSSSPNSKLNRFLMK